MTSPQPNRRDQLHRRQQRQIRTTLAAATMTGLLLVGASPAQAHTDLVSSNPADGARLDRGPAQITMQFNQKIEPRFAAVSLTAGNSPPLRLTARVSGATVTAAVPESQWRTATTTPIRTRLAYRVVSADGHPVSGVITFTLTPTASTSAPTTPTTPATIPSPTPTRASPGALAPEARETPPSDKHLLAVILLSIAVVAAAAAVVGLLVYLRRPPQGREDR